MEKHREWVLTFTQLLCSAMGAALGAIGGSEAPSAGAQRAFEVWLQGVLQRRGERKKAKEVERHTHTQGRRGAAEEAEGSIQDVPQHTCEASEGARARTHTYTHTH